MTVVVDHETSRVVWAARGRNADTLSRFFEDLGADRRKEIQSVTIDMSAAYVSSVKASVPRARLIFDRRHVQWLAQDAVDETRRDEVRGMEGGDERRTLKNTRYTLLKSPWNLTDKDVQTLGQLEESNKALFHGYLLKGSFAAALSRRQMHVARRHLGQRIADARDSALRHSPRVASTIEKHIDCSHERYRRAEEANRPDRRSSRGSTSTPCATKRHEAGVGR